ncbi:hypothetical protein KA005_29455 [bacterium]|nr:hypothetical protein [bacterium]
MEDSVAQNDQGCEPKEEFTGKNLTRFGGAGLVPPLMENRLRRAFKTADLQTSH